MALTFGGAASDRVTVTQNSSINTLTTKTVYGWFYPTTITADRRLFGKGPNSGSFEGFDLAINDASGNLNWYVQRTTNSHQTSSSSPLTVNKWWFVAGTYDVGAAQPTRLYIGDLNTAAIEPSYSDTTVGSGATASDATSDLKIGNFGNANTQAFQGRIGLVGMINRALTLAEIVSLQFKPRVVNGTVLFMPLGYNGAGTQSDLSGNANSGTVTGATLTQEGLPLRSLFAFGDDVQTPVAAVVSCATGGNITASINEGDIVTGGKVLTLTLNNDTWVAAGATFDAQRQNIINGIDSAQAEGTGWDAVVKATLAVTAVVRTSSTVVTITLSAFASYNITATETITATVPATALTGGLPLVAAPTFTVAPVTVLTAGTASFVSKTATTMSVSATAPAGGTSPYTYQWERRVGNTGSYSNVSGATSLTLTDTGLTSGELYEYRCKQTDNVAATVTTNSIALTRTWIDPNNQAIYFSPFNTYSDGAGALAANNVKASSTYVLWNNAGAYFKTKVTTPASGVIKIELDTSMLSGITANQCPSFYCAIDGGPATLTPVTLAYSASTVELTLASGLSAATHTVEFFFKGLYTGDGLPGNESDRWNPVRQAIKILGLDINTTATMVATSVRPYTMLAYGASHYEGIDCLGTGGTSNVNTDATRSIIYMLARALDAEFGVVAFSGQGFVKGINRVTASSVEPALKNATPANESWDKYFAGQSRLVGGLYSPIPDYVIIGTGTNDFAVPLAAGSVTPALDAIRTACDGNTWIFVVNDIAGSQSAALAGGVAAAAVQTRLRHIIPTVLITTSNGFTSTKPSYFSFDSASGGAHPNPEGNQAHGAEVIALIKAQLDAAAGSGGAGGTLVGSVVR